MGIGIDKGQGLRIARRRDEIIPRRRGGNTQRKNELRRHQADLRPNWEPYFHWVGLYGSEDDNVNAGYDHPRMVLARGREYEQSGKFRERQRREIAAGRGRYRFLPAHPAERPNGDLDERITCLNMKRLVRALLSRPEAPRIWNRIRQGRG